MRFLYKTTGTCSRSIEFDINDNIVTNVIFEGGCNGNLKALSRFVEGLSAEEILNKCEGILCGYRNTSCADQFAKAVKIASNKDKNI